MKREYSEKYLLIQPGRYRGKHFRNYRLQLPCISLAQIPYKKPLRCYPAMHNFESQVRRLRRVNFLGKADCLY